MLAIRLPPEIEARLAELARRTGRTKSFYAREAILNHLDELEDVYLAEIRLEDLARRPQRVESIERSHPAPWRGGLSSSAPPRGSSTSLARSQPNAFFASFATGSLRSMTPVRSVRR